MTAITLKSRIFDRLTDEEFVDFCIEHRDLKIERSATGEIIIMSPTFSETGNFNNEISFQLTYWNKINQSGKVFDSSTGFTLPNGAMRSPDACWVPNAKWNALTDAQKKSFAPVCPDFVIELRSASDLLKNLQDKMEEWIDNGCRLAWLIDLQDKTIYIYRADGSKNVAKGFAQAISGEEILPGFELNLNEWEG